MPLPSATGPVVAALNVTPSNTTVFTMATRALYVGTTGNVVVTWHTSNTELFPASEGYTSNTTFVDVPGGTILPVRVTKVLTTTTANNIVALF